MPEYTTAQIQVAIAAAIKDKDFPAVRALVERLAVQDPQAAADVLATIKLGMAVAALTQYDGTPDA